MTSLQFSEGPDSPEPYTHRKQLLNHMVDGLAKARPLSVWAETPKSTTSYEAGFHKVTYRAFSNAINGVAWWLHDSLGQGQDFETLAYFGLWDIRYVVLLLGAVKAGYKMIFPSPKYSLAGLEQLLKDLRCKMFLVLPSSPPVVSEYLTAHEPSVLNVPTVEFLLNTEFPHYPFGKSFATARNEPLVALHTSGSTSHPKPIIWTHDYAASFIQQHQRMPPPEFESVDKFYQGNRLIPMLPPFHAGNLFGTLLVAIGSQTTVVYPLPNAVLNAETLVNVVQHNSLDVAVASPHVIEQLATDSTMQYIVCKNVKALGYAGGDISQAAGNRLADDVILFSSYASTENGVTPTIRPRSSSNIKNWKRWQPHPESGTEFRHLANDEYEAVIIRKTTEEEQPAFKVFPHLREWSTKDVFTPDPLEPGVWIYRSRVDDMIVFADGTTFNPLEFEQQISGHPEVQAALMFGTQRPQAALLIELQSPEALSGSTRMETLERLWESVAQANKVCTAQSRVLKSHILFTQPEKPLPRAGKGTVQRVPALRLYQNELDSLYV